MTPELKTLARELVAAWMPWLPGMRAVDGDAGSSYYSRLAAGGWYSRIAGAPYEPLPDLNDPATLGAIWFGIVKARWPDAELSLHVEKVWDAHIGGRVVVGIDTEPEAIAIAAKLALETP